MHEIFRGCAKYSSRTLAIVRQNLRKTPIDFVEFTCCRRTLYHKIGHVRSARMRSAALLVPVIRPTTPLQCGGRGLARKAPSLAGARRVFLEAIAGGVREQHEMCTSRQISSDHGALHDRVRFHAASGNLIGCFDLIEQTRSHVCLFAHNAALRKLLAYI